LRGELLAAARRLLDAAGSDAGVTLRGVAREAAVAAPSIYNHFPRLDDLLLALAGRELDDLAGAIARALHRSRRLAPPDRLHAACRAYVRWGLDHPGRYAVAVTRAPALPARPPNPLLQVLPALLAELDLAPAATRSAAIAIWTGLHGVVGLRCADPAFRWPAVARQVDAVLAGALPVPTGPALPGPDGGGPALPGPDGGEPD
jgi:AcrR family transcriptional regulator